METFATGRGPLVSIGIPTYNRAKQLRRTIENACAQTYPNLQIIVSDNASTDPQVEALCRDAAERDPRIKYYRQPFNKGPMANFEFTLLQASGDYFIWFADDDERTSKSIENLLKGFSTASPQTVLVCTEAQYEHDGVLFPYFAEGASFYESSVGSMSERISLIVRRGPGNLIYGLFRRDALFHNGLPLTNWIGKSLNELPMFALVASKGHVLYLPEIGLRKRASLPVCRGAMWEQRGGFNKNGPNPNLPGIVKYHWTVFGEISLAYDATDMTAPERDKLKAMTRRHLAVHALQYALGWKRRRKADCKR